MALVLWLGSDSGSAERTGRLIVPILRWLFPAAAPLQLEVMHAAVRKLGHVIEYAVLAGLWFHALAARGGRTPAGAAGLSWAIALGCAVADESLQATTRSRTASMVDVGLDVAGAALVALPAGVGWRGAIDAATSIALWTAAIGGSVLLAVNWMTRVDSGLLWVATPAAVLVLFLRRRPRR
jgi:VanZ family protein